MKTLVMGILLSLSCPAVARPVVAVKEVLAERWALSWRHIEAYVEGGSTSIPLFSQLLEDTSQVGEVLRRDFSKFTAGHSFWLHKLGYPPLEPGKKGATNAVGELGNLVNSLSASDTQQVALQLLQQAQHLFTVEVAATRLLQLGRSNVAIDSKEWQLLAAVVDLRNKARDAAQTNVTATMDAWEKLHNYHQCSLIPFNALLDSTCLNIKGLVYKNVPDIYRLLAYQRGEDIIGEEEVAVLEEAAMQKQGGIGVVSHILNISQLNLATTQNIKPMRDRYRSHLERMRSSLRIEQEAKMLQERAVELTPVQKKFIATIERVRGEALVQLDNNVDLHAIRHYHEAQTTSAFLFADILTELDMSVAKLAVTSGVSDKAIMAQQAGKEMFTEKEAKLVIATLTQARDHLPAPSWWRQICNSVGKNRICLAAHKQHLSRLLADFAVALRVERYLQDARLVAAE